MFLSDGWTIGSEPGYLVSTSKVVNESVSLVGRMRATGAVLPNGTQVRGYVVTITAKLDGPLRQLPDAEALGGAVLAQFRSMPDPPEMPVSPGNMRVPVQCVKSG